MGAASRSYLTGGTGYIGGRLAPLLLDAGHEVVCLTRSRKKLEGRTWASRPGVTIVEGDLDASVEALSEGMRGCRTAYYLVHAMRSAGGAYAERDRRFARTFALACERAGVEHIVYLGGLGELGDGLSEHLLSRREVEDELRSHRATVTVLRAAMIIGSGSASFEILRYLAERLPVMLTPRWVRTECQPIAVRNVLEYLVMLLDTPEAHGRTLDIGGRDIVRYQDLIRMVGEERGLPRRLIVPVPVLTPRLSSLWLHLVTPVPASVGRPLAEGLRNRVVCRNDDVRRLMPTRVLSAREAITRAIGKVDESQVETVWSSAGVIPGDPDWAGGKVFTDRRERVVDASCGAAFAAIQRLGGGHGWYAVNWLWQIRGLMDKVVGGPGLRRGRRDTEELAYGEALDFWRIIGIERDRRLTLLAEMKLPGEAQLEFSIVPEAGGGSRIVQEARFKPKGLLGLAYWCGVAPLHAVVFSGMLRGIARVAEGIEGESVRGVGDERSPGEVP
ncbi:MAG: SDR family oxidoreductase [Phycisphaerales bacterium]